jgi:hypothetical protein
MPCTAPSRRRNDNAHSEALKRFCGKPSMAPAWPGRSWSPNSDPMGRETRERNHSGNGQKWNLFEFPVHGGGLQNPRSRATVDRFSDNRIVRQYHDPSHHKPGPAGRPPPGRFLHRSPIRRVGQADSRRSLSKCPGRGAGVPRDDRGHVSPIQAATLTSEPTAENNYLAPHG